MSAAPISRDASPSSAPDDIDPYRSGESPARPGVQRLEVTRRSRAVLRLHLVRAVVRMSVLAASDSAALILLATALSQVLATVAVRPFGIDVLALAIPASVLEWRQLVASVLLGQFVLDTYGPGDRRRDSGRLFAGAALGVGLPYWASLWSSFSIYAVPGFLLVALVAGAVITAERFLIDFLVYRFWPEGAAAARVLVVGRPEEVRQVVEHPALADRRMFVIRGRFDVNRLRIHGPAHGVQALCKMIRRHRADTIVMGGSLDDEAFGLIVDAASAAGCQVLALTRALAVGGVEPKVVWLHGVPLVQLMRPSFHWRQLVVKRTIDVLLSATALVLLSPIFLLVALAVRLSSPGPIFFLQERVGLGGRRFRIIKFRSMVPDAEERRAEIAAQSVYPDRRLFKVKDDPRVTPVGAVLRRTSLDELPQLLNVLLGEMSLVGPRPPLPSEVELYEEHHYNRFDVKPGITGPWQAGGRNALTDFEEIIRLETAYIREWSIWKDINILLRTIPVVLSRRGAH